MSRRRSATSVPPSRLGPLRRPRRAWRPPSRPIAPRSSSSATGSTPTPRRRSRSTRPRPGSPIPCAVTASRSSCRPAAWPPRFEPDWRGVGRRTGRGPATDRDPRRVRRIAGPGSRLRPQHDGGLRARRGARPRGARAGASRRDRLPRHAGRGAGLGQGGDDRGRLVRGPRRSPPLPPVGPDPCDLRAAGQRGRRGDVPRLPGPRRVGSVARPERARRHDPAVHLGRPVAPAAPARGAGPRDRSSRAARPPTSSPSGPGRGS